MTDTNDNPTCTNSEYLDVNRHVRELLAKHHSIAAIWCIEDVQGIRPDLSNEEAWDVLQDVDDHHDAEWGISWTTLETVADDLYPKTTSPQKEKRHGN
jgi:hypothetical protein